jgi:putative Holliday junction resolvase
MGKILALDVGEKTIGIALSDETETYVFPRKTLWRQEGYRRDMNLLRDLVQAEGVSEIVVGMPFSMSGNRGVQAQKVEQFIAMLKRYVNLPIHEEDERLSTFEADTLLAAAGHRADQRKQMIDSIAAGVILENFLESRKKGKA